MSIRISDRISLTVKLIYLNHKHLFRIVDHSVGSIFYPLFGDLDIATHSFLSKYKYTLLKKVKRWMRL
jgi:hypothetical protein